MKRTFALLGAFVLLLGATACSPTDGDYQKGLAALEDGDYLTAYTHLSASTDQRAAEVLERLVFVPTEEEEQIPDGTIHHTTYTYNEDGFLLKKEVSANDSTIATQYTYDEQNRLLKTEEGGEVPAIFTYTYDEAGNRLSRRVEIDGTVTHYTYTYDEQNRCITTKQVNQDGSTFLTTNRYDENGNKTYEKVDYADGMWQEQTFTYTADGKPLTESGISSAEDRYQRTYTYNEAGLLVKDTTPSGEYTYTYDEAGQLIQSVEPDGYILTYTYDEAGNRLTEKLTTPERAYLVTYTYDQNGNCLSIQYDNGESRTFTYDSYGNKTAESYISMRDQHTLWHFKWELHYYPDGVPEEVEQLRLSTVNMQPVL